MKARCRLRSSVLIPFLLFLTTATGCRNCEMVEMALRARETDVENLREENTRLKAYNEALMRELVVVRQSSPTKMTPELASQTYTLRSITLARGTGGYDTDNKFGDDSLKVIVQPRDMAGDVIKSPGTIFVTALEISPEGLKTPIGTWKRGPQEIRTQWKEGLFTSGYDLVLPWQQAPKSEKIRVIVRFQLIDGRQFEADKDVTIRLPDGPAMPDSHGNTAPAIVIPDSGEEVLPLPREMQPGNPTPNQEGPIIHSSGHWRAPSLEDSVQLMRPVPLYPRTPNVPGPY